MTKVTDRMLGNILRGFVGDHPKKWDQTLPQVGFAYNESPNKSKGLSPFWIVYSMHPRGIWELRDLGKQEMTSIDAEHFSTTI